MDKDGFTKWVKQCREYAVEIGLMEDGCELTLGAYCEYDRSEERDTAYAGLNNYQDEVRVQFNDAPRNRSVTFPVEK